MKGFYYFLDADNAFFGNGKLIITNPSSQTFYMSDRPNRITGHMPSTEFLNNWNSHIFIGSSPNVMLYGRGSHNEPLSIVLGNPKLLGIEHNKKLKEITGRKSIGVVFDAKNLNDGELPKHIINPHLFIDSGFLDA